MKEMETVGIAIIGLFIVVAAAFALTGGLSGSGQAAVQPTPQGLLVPILDGKQYAKIGMRDLQYDPNYLRVKVGIPVRLEKAGSAGAAGTVVAFLVGACPACAGLATLLLPAGVALFITTNTLLFNAAAVALLLLGIATLGGFRKSSASQAPL